ncbi:MAG: glycerophosphodiester phosphodiesterase family protein [Spirochaetota bacterium]
MSKSVLTISHMGYGGKYPRNTLLSLRKAADINADLAEIDVQLTKDHHFVLLHENDFSEHYSAGGRPSEMTLAEVRKIDAGVRCDPRYAGEKVPTLQEAFECILNYPMNLCIEFKIKPENDPAEIAAYADRFFQASAFWGRFVINSFNRDFLALMKRRDNRYRILYDLNLKDMDYDIESLVAAAIRLQADGVEHPYAGLNETAVYELHRNCLSVWVWTVNEREEIARMIDMSVDGILSDYPDRVIEVIHEKMLQD